MTQRTEHSLSEETFELVFDIARKAPEHAIPAMLHAVVQHYFMRGSKEQFDSYTGTLWDILELAVECMEDDSR